MSWLTIEQIENMGFASCGENVMLSDKASYYNCKNIRLGSNLRIDDFCILSAGEGGIDIGNYIHIAVSSSLIGAGNITLEDFSGISSRVSIFSSNEDYSGEFMTNPTIHDKYKNLIVGKVTIGRHAIIGAGSVILPNVTLEKGVVIGALSLVKKSCKAFGVYHGNPAKRIASRKTDLLRLEELFVGVAE